MTHGSLFSGIGGFDLAAEWMGWENIFHCEINEFGQLILKKHFPNAQSHKNIRETDFTQYRNTIDVLSGGFPCQEFSVIGKQKGDKGERYMWPDYFRAVKEIRPVWVVPENVHGIVSWSDGRIFEQICNDLESEGYQVSPVILPANSVGLPHKRNRIWIIAYSAERRLERGNHICQEGHRKTTDRPVQALVEDRDWYSFARSFVSGNIHGISRRVDRTAALGNAVVPQIPFKIFKTIEQYENLSSVI